LLLLETKVDKDGCIEVIWKPW